MGMMISVLPVGADMFSVTVPAVVSLLHTMVVSSNFNVPLLPEPSANRLSANCLDNCA